jgi:hypothetical protein
VGLGVGLANPNPNPSRSPNLVVCGALVHAQLAIGGESARCQRRALAHLVRVRVRVRVSVRVRVKG